MKLLTRNTDYAVRAICYMASKGEGVISVTEMVTSLRMPRPFLRKILQALGKKGLVRSYKGIGGGFELARPPRAIYLSDLMEAFQGEFSMNECIFKRKLCPDRAACPLRKKIGDIERRAREEIGSITIDSLLRG